MTMPGLPRVPAADSIKLNKDGEIEGLFQTLAIKFSQFFNTPAFNYDEVVTLPSNATLLSSNKVNNVMGINFKSELSNIWGIQYHPEITYEKMITLINFRKERLLENKSFNDENDLNSHIKIIENEIKITNKDLRMKELKNWLNLIANV